MDETSQAYCRARARVGEVLRGKYTLDEVIGVGGMATVFRATHRNRAELAIKMLHPAFSQDERVRQRFLREGYTANSVKHTGVVLVVDDDVADDGSAFLVMELVRGQDLDAVSRASGGRLPAGAVVAIAIQLLDVLVTAHARGIVHRDIKPANLLLASGGVVKVLDFGIARARDALTDPASITGTGMVLGTPAFMAPEQALARTGEVDGQTDVWAVGATMFTLLSGHMVHEAKSGQEAMIRTATLPARSLATVAPEVAAPVVALVDRALSFDKAGRWPTAAAMLHALREVATRTFGDVPGPATLAGLLARAPAASTGDEATASTENALVTPALQATTPAPAAAIPGPSRAAEETMGSATASLSTSTGAASVAASGRSTGRRGSGGKLLGAGVAGAVLVLAAALARQTGHPPVASGVPAAAALAPPVMVGAAPTVAVDAPPSATAAAAVPDAAIGAAPAIPPSARRPVQAPVAPSVTRQRCHTTSWVDDTGETHVKQVCP